MSIKSSIMLATLIILASCSDVKQPPEQALRTVLTTEIKHGNSQDLSRIAGELRAKERASLGFETSGIIADMYVDLGDSFLKGDILAQLDQTKAQLNLESRQSDLLNVKAEMDDAQLNFDRVSSLSGTGAVSMASIDQARARLKRAKARFSSSESAIATAEKQLKESFLFAPFDGEVVKRISEPSQVLSVGQTVLEVEGSDSGLEAVVSVPENIKSNLQLKDKHMLRNLSSNHLINTEVVEIGSQTNSAGLFPITLALIGDTSSANSGQAVEVEFNKTNKKTADAQITIPLTAYTMDANGQASVFVLDQLNGLTIARQRQVMLGRFLDYDVVINEGLNVGEVIVSKGVDLLTDDQQVNVLDLSIERFGN